MGTWSGCKMFDKCHVFHLSILFQNFHQHAVRNQCSVAIRRPTKFNLSKGWLRFEHLFKLLFKVIIFQRADQSCSLIESLAYFHFGAKKGGGLCSSKILPVSYMGSSVTNNSKTRLHFRWDGTSLRKNEEFNLREDLAWSFFHTVQVRRSYECDNQQAWICVNVKMSTFGSDHWLAL